MESQTRPRNERPSGGSGKRIARQRIEIPIQMTENRPTDGTNLRLHGVFALHIQNFLAISDQGNENTGFSATFRRNISCNRNFVPKL